LQYVVHDGVLVGAILYGDITYFSLVMEAIERKMPIAENQLLIKHLEKLIPIIA